MLTLTGMLMSQKLLWVFQRRENREARHRSCQGSLILLKKANRSQQSAEKLEESDDYSEPQKSRGTEREGREEPKRCFVGLEGFQLHFLFIHWDWVNKSSGGHHERGQLER